MPLNAEKITCSFCNGAVPVPNEYRHTGRLREESARKLRNAARHIRLARLFTSRTAKWSARVLAVWLVAVPIILIIADSYAQLGPYEKLMGENVEIAGIAFVTLLFWVLILVVFSYSIVSGARAVLPELEFGSEIGKVEDTGCAQCGAPIRYEKGDIAAICGYCGVETYRARLAWDLHNIANNARQMANFSLINAKNEFTEAIWEAAFTPLFLVSIFIVVPMLFVGLYLAAMYLAEYLLGSLAVSSVVIVAVLLLINRRRLKRLFGK